MTRSGKDNRFSRSPGGVALVWISKTESCRSLGLALVRNDDNLGGLGSLRTTSQSRRGERDSVGLSSRSVFPCCPAKTAHRRKTRTIRASAASPYEYPHLTPQ